MLNKSKNVLINGYPVRVGDEDKDWLLNCLKPGFFIIKGKYRGKTFSSSVLRNGNKYNVNINGATFEAEHLPDKYYEEQDRINSDESKILSPMTGVIKDILVNEGDKVNPGQLLLRIESMKIVLSFNSSNKGIIKEIRVKTGQKVSAGDLVMEIVK